MNQDLCTPGHEARSSSSGQRDSALSLLGGASRLVVDASTGVTDAVEQMHLSIGSGPALLGRPWAPLVKLSSTWIYANVRLVTRLVGLSIEQLLQQLESIPGLRGSAPALNPLRAMLNGVCGDHLAATHNPLALPMQLCAHGQALELSQVALSRAFPEPSKQLVLYLHGSSMDVTQLTRNGHNHALALAKTLGWSALELRYNSGLHIAQNGRSLASLLQTLQQNWPVELERLVLLGFSMGGLLARSAVCIAEEQRLAWRERLCAMVFLGTPHLGAPLERAGKMAELLLTLSSHSAPLARLAQVRSAGITDLRHGAVLEEGKRCPLPSELACYAVAASSSPELPAEGEKAAGDGLVPVESALGRCADPRRALGIPTERTLVVPQTSHLGLLDSTVVFEQLLAWFGEAVAPG